MNYKFEPYCYIVYDGDNEEFGNFTMQHKIQINIVNYPDVTEHYQEELNSISEILLKRKLPADSLNADMMQLIFLKFTDIPQISYNQKYAGDFNSFNSGFVETVCREL